MRAGLSLNKDGCLRRAIDESFAELPRHPHGPECIRETNACKLPPPLFRFGSAQKKKRGAAEALLRDGAPLTTRGGEYLALVYLSLRVSAPYIRLALLSLADLSALGEETGDVDQNLRAHAGQGSPLRAQNVDVKTRIRPRRRQR